MDPARGHLTTAASAGLRPAPAQDPGGTPPPLKHSTGGTRESYAPEGINRRLLTDLLLPLEQAVRLCRMIWLPPFAIQGTYRLSEAALADYATLYRRGLAALAQAPAVDSIRRYPLLNDWIRTLGAKEES